MDIATLLGFATAFGLVGFGIASGVGIGAFIDTQSLLIVLGGTVGATLINYPLGQVLGAAGVAKNAFMYKLIDAKEVITQMADFGELVYIADRNRG